MNRARLTSITLAAALAASAAMAQTASDAPATMDMPMASEDASPATKAYIDAMTAMHSGMAIPYSGDADIDLMVEDPTGSVCSFRAPRSAAGGHNQKKKRDTPETI